MGKLVDVQLWSIAVDRRETKIIFNHRVFFLVLFPEREKTGGKVRALVSADRDGDWFDSGFVLFWNILVFPVVSGKVGGVHSTKLAIISHYKKDLLSPKTWDLSWFFLCAPRVLWTLWWILHRGKFFSRLIICSFFPAKIDREENLSMKKKLWINGWAAFFAPQLWGKGMVNTIFT